MSTQNQCRFAFHVGLSYISHVKIETCGNSWRVISSGLVPIQNLNIHPQEARQRLQEALQKLVKQEGISREPVHVSLHNRICITRVVTGNRNEVEAQLAEIVDNSQHYLQLGLGDKLIGHTTVPIDESRQHGQVAIIKRGLIETIEGVASFAGLDLISVDGALTSISRLAGIAKIDRAPMLLIWVGSTGAEIGISYKGRLQLNYHSGECVDNESTALTIGRHLKRLRRFCDRYRQVDGSTDLRRVLVLTKNGESEGLRDLLEQYDFEHVYTLEDLKATALSSKLDGHELASAGSASALGGLLVHLEPDVLPTTDVYQKYLEGKPKSLAHIVLSDGWPLLASAALLACALCTGWAMAMWVSVNEARNASVSSTFDLERQQLLKLDAQRSILKEYHRLSAKVNRHSIRHTVSQVAACLPEDCRLDWCNIDAQGGLILKGTMLQGDRTYEVLKALRDLPEISEVALESVGNSSTQGKNATLFEIQCEMDEQSLKSNKPSPDQAHPMQLTATSGSNR